MQCRKPLFYLVFDIAFFNLGYLPPKNLSIVRAGECDII